MISNVINFDEYLIQPILAESFITRVCSRQKPKKPKTTGPVEVTVPSTTHGHTIHAA